MYLLHNFQKLSVLLFFSLYKSTLEHIDHRFPQGDHLQYVSPADRRIHILLPYDVRIDSFTVKFVKNLCTCVFCAEIFVHICNVNVRVSFCCNSPQAQKKICVSTISANEESFFFAGVCFPLLSFHEVVACVEFSSVVEIICSHLCPIVDRKNFWQTIYLPSSSRNNIYIYIS